MFKKSVLTASLIIAISGIGTVLAGPNENLNDEEID